MAGARLDDDDGPALVMFGGCTSSCCYAPVDTLWRLKVSTQEGNGDAAVAAPAATWDQIARGDGPWPAPRFGAAAAAAMDPSIMLLFGGMSSVLGPLAELWAYDLPEGAWHLLEQDVAPPARAAAASASVLDHFVVFGGIGQSSLLSDLWVLPPFDVGEGANVGWRPVPAVGGDSAEKPPALANAVMAPLLDTGGDLALYIFGGSDAAGVDQDVLWCAVLRQDEVSGDFSATWEALAPAGGALPPPRHAAAVLAAPTSTGRSIVIFGGQSGTRDTDPFLGDVWRYDVLTNKWEELSGGGGGSGDGDAEKDEAQDSFGGEFGSGTGGSSSGRSPGFGTVVTPRALRGDEATEKTTTTATAASAATATASSGSAGDDVPDARSSALVVASSSVPGSASATVLFGGFSGYGGGLDDRLRNDIWVWSAGD